LGNDLTRGVLPTVVCLSVNEEPHRGDLRTLGLSSHEKKCIGLFIVIRLDLEIIYGSIVNDKRESDVREEVLHAKRGV